MSNDEKANIAHEIFQSLPMKEAYADAVSPGAKVVGQILEDTMKAVQIALAPIQIAGVAQDRFRRFINKARDKVPKSRQAMPAPQIIGPILEGIRYEPEDTSIEEMFAELLASAMEQERISSTHPAFPQIITQLSSDEAVLLKAIAERPCRRHYRHPLDRAPKPADETINRCDLRGARSASASARPLLVAALDRIPVAAFSA